MKKAVLTLLLPPAYVVPREGTVLTGVCLSTGGGGVRSVQLGGGSQVSPAGGGGGQSAWGVGQVSSWGGVRSVAGGVGQVSGGGGSAKIGQQKEYSLHGGRYASCVHAGGLSC